MGKNRGPEWNLENGKKGMGDVCPLFGTGHKVLLTGNLKFANSSKKLEFWNTSKLANSPTLKCAYKLDLFYTNAHVWIHFYVTYMYEFMITFLPWEGSHHMHHPYQVAHNVHRIKQDQQDLAFKGGNKAPKYLHFCCSTAKGHAVEGLAGIKQK
eukprot:688508-Pelagomonas_calceolata.AAC.1